MRPSPWKPGSSYSHLDYSTFAGTPDRADGVRHLLCFVRSRSRPSRNRPAKGSCWQTQPPITLCLPSLDVDPPQLYRAASAFTLTINGTSFVDGSSGALERCEPSDDVCERHTVDGSYCSSRRRCVRHSERSPCSTLRLAEAYRLARVIHASATLLRPLLDSNRSPLHRAVPHSHSPSVVRVSAAVQSGSLERFESDNDVCQQYTTDSSNRCCGCCYGKYCEHHRLQPCAWWGHIRCDVVLRGNTKDSRFAPCGQKLIPASIPGDAGTER